LHSGSTYFLVSALLLQLLLSQLLELGLFL
jgi:hypothetical protein